MAFEVVVRQKEKKTSLMHSKGWWEDNGWSGVVQHDAWLAAVRNVVLHYLLGKGEKKTLCASMGRVSAS
jgi:hypothetical protein